MTGTNSEVFERIFKAADSLYEEGGRVDFPTVDAVRKAAKVNMNDASAAMKQWRRAQTAQAAPIVVQVPESIAQVGSQAMATIWQQAQELANDSLRSAQAGWEAERQELDVMRQELATAFEEQGEELKHASARIAELETQLEASFTKNTELTASCAEATRLHSVAEGRAEELAQRASDLRMELDRAYGQADAAKDEVRTLKATMEKEREARSQERIKHGDDTQVLKVELASVKSTAEAGKETIKRLNDDIDAIKRTKDSDIADLKDSHSKVVGKLEEQLSSSQSQASSTANELAEAKELIAELRGKLSDLADLKKEHKKEVGSLEAQLSSCESQAKAATAKCEKQAGELAEAKELIAELRGKLSVLEVKPEGKA